MKKIKLTQGYEAIVDDEDFEYLNQFKWYYCNGYAMRNKLLSIEGETQGLVRMHRIINNTPEGLFTDHINRNKLDNRRSNLRTVTKSLNEHNKGIRTRNRSGVNGVCWNKSRNKWQVEIMVNRKHLFLGYYSTLEEASKARSKGESYYEI